MKRNLLLAALFLTQISFVLAQSLVVTGDTVFASDPNSQITHHLDVKNTSSSSITIVCQKTNLTLPLGMPTWAGSTYCFGGTCYSSTSILPSASVVFAPGQTISYDNSDVDAFSGYFSTGGIAGQAKVEYCFYDQNNPSDETCKVITYNFNVTGVDDIVNEFSEFFPNPAQEYINFDYNVVGDATLKIIDILGNVVKEVQLSEDGRKKVYVGDMSKGVYFGNLTVNDELISIKKLIIK